MMALPQIVSRNQVQKIASEPITGRVVLQPNTWYTCPTGQKAVIKGTAVCTGLGAAADSSFLAAGVALKRVLAAGGGSNPWDNLPGPNINFPFEVQLAAGEIIETTQNTGTNSEWNVFANVEETPA